MTVVTRSRSRILTQAKMEAALLDTSAESDCAVDRTVATGAAITPPARPDVRCTSVRCRAGRQLSGVRPYRRHLLGETRRRPVGAVVSLVVADPVESRWHPELHSGGRSGHGRVGPTRSGRRHRLSHREEAAPYGLGGDLVRAHSSVQTSFSPCAPRRFCYPAGWSLPSLDRCDSCSGARSCFS